MAKRFRQGKAYEHTVVGLLTLEGFDVYYPVVDDQGIDGVIRVPSNVDGLPHYFELQIKGSHSWDKIRCKTGRLKRAGILVLYCAKERAILWFLYEELADLFPHASPEWGDIFLKPKQVEQFKLEGRGNLAELRKRIGISN